MSDGLRSTDVKNINGESLNARIAATKVGQCTWANPSSGKKCASCAHYADGQVSKGKHEGHGRCGLVKVHSRKTGALFDGVTAWACTLFTSRT